MRIRPIKGLEKLGMIEQPIGLIPTEVVYDLDLAVHITRLWESLVREMENDEHVIVAPGGPFEIRPSVRPPEGPTGVLGPQCTPGPSMLLSSLSKPLSYSVDAYRSLKDAEFVAVSSFPVLSGSNNGNVRAGDRIKPYAVGKTLQDATSKLADSIRAWTGRKELSVINEHLHIDRYICVHCQGFLSTFPSKQDLITHLNNSHSGNLSIDRYTNPTAANNWLVLP